MLTQVRFTTDNLVFRYTLHSKQQYKVLSFACAGPATVDLLRAYYSSMVPMLAGVACLPLPTSPAASIAALHQRAWLLELFALQLHNTDTAVPSHLEGAEHVLRALFTGSHGDDDSALESYGRGRVIDVLITAIKHLPTEPQLGGEAGFEVRRMMQALDIEGLLAALADGQQGAFQGTSLRGDVLLDIIALKDHLLQRYNDWVARNGAPTDALKEAGRRALLYAAEYNTYVEFLGAQAALLAGWRALITVVFSKRFDVLVGLVGSTAAATDLVVATAEDTLEATSHLLRGHGSSLAPALCSSLEALFARLQEQVLAAASADPLTGVPLPARCHSLLGLLCSVLWSGRTQEDIRLPLYSAMSSYLAMCRGPGLLRSPPSVISALMEGIHGGPGGGVEQLDAVQVQLEEGNVGILHSNLQLLGVLAADAVAANPKAVSAACLRVDGFIHFDHTISVVNVLLVIRMFCCRQLQRSQPWPHLLATIQLS